MTNPEIAELLTEAAHHLKEHTADYDHVSPKELQDKLLKAAKQLKKAAA